MAGRGNARSARRSGTNVNQEQEPKADDSTHCLKITSRQTWTPEQKLDMADDKAQQRPPPDPEEDDLDDLDEVLDEFSKKPQPADTSKEATGPGRPAAERSSSVNIHNDEAFAKSLETGMQSLLGELDANPEMQKEFEKMMAELISAGSAPTDAEAAKHIGNAADVVTSSDDKIDDKNKESFQETIRKTMERMQASGESASAAAAAAPNEDDFLAQMMKELSAAGGGAGGEEDFNKMLMGMMAQLTNKEILYEPMKELHDKFPAWLEKNASTTSADELTRYKDQQKLVGEIVVRFEKPGYSDDNEEDREYIVDKMQKMQAQGSPPPDLVGDMSAAQEALGDFESGCPTQ